jgi:hypothetical protein
MSFTIKLSTEELKLLTTLASDQLFRREFIDPKMPGYKTDPEEIKVGKALVTRLRTELDPTLAKRTQTARLVR